MDQDRVTLFDAVGLAHQILGGEALEHHRRSGFVGNRARELEQEPRFDIPLLRVGAWGAGVSDPVACLQPLDRRTDLDHLARPLRPGRERRLRRRIEARAMIDVDEVDPDRMLAQPDLAFAWWQQLDLLKAHHFRTAGLIYADGAHRFLWFMLLPDTPAEACQ